MKKLIALVLALVCVLGLVACSQQEEPVDTNTVDEECLELPDIEVEQIDYSPMVMFNDILYTATSYSGDKEDLSVVGKIESCIDYGVPTENYQANDNLIGREIYTSSSAPDYIFVLNNGVYSPYKSTDGAGIE